jgi:hypothetical protein
MTGEQIFVYAVDCARQATSVAARRDVQRDWKHRICEEVRGLSPLCPTEIRQIVEDGWRFGSRTPMEIFS